MENFLIRVINILAVVLVLVLYNQSALTRQSEVLAYNEQKAEYDAAVLAAEQAKLQTTEQAKMQTAEQAQDTGNTWIDGTYEGTGEGFGGPIDVQVTVTGGKLASIAILSAEKEDSAYLSQAKGIIDSMISAQSAEVDTISGATFSSTGIKTAVKQALEGSGK